MNMKKLTTLFVMICAVLSFLSVSALAAGPSIAGDLVFADGSTSMTILQNTDVEFDLDVHGEANEFTRVISVYKLGDSSTVLMHLYQDSDSYAYWGAEVTDYLGTDAASARTYESETLSFDQITAAGTNYLALSGEGTFVIKSTVTDSYSGNSHSDSLTLYIEADSDRDGTPDDEDLCEGHDDSEDMDQDGFPDGCDEQEWILSGSDITIQEGSTGSVTVRVDPNDGAETMLFGVTLDAVSADGSSTASISVSETVYGADDNSLQVDVGSLYDFIDHANYPDLIDEFTLTVTALDDADGDGEYDNSYCTWALCEHQISTSITVTVEDVNQDPYQDGICQIIVSEDSLTVNDLSAFVADDDLDDLRFTSLVGAESWLSITGNTEVTADLTGNFDAGQTAPYTFDIMVEDLYPTTSISPGGVTRISCEVLVGDTPRPPYVFATETGPLTFEEGDIIDFAELFTYGDPDGLADVVAVNPVLTPVFPSTHTFQDEADSDASGEGEVSLYYEIPTDGSAIGTYTAGVSVTDNTALSASDDIIINIIEGTPTNDAPEFDTGIHLDDKSYEGQLFEHEFEVVDPEGDALTFTASVDAAALLNLEDHDGDGTAVDFDYDVTTGIATMSFMPSYEFVIHPNTQDQFEMQITVSDGTTAVDSDIFEVIVVDVNREPEFTSTPDTTAVEDEEYTYTAVAVDEDTEDVLKYTILDAPSGAEMNEDTGELIWPAQPGTHNFEILVEDGMGGSDTQTWTVEVSEDDGSDEEDPVIDEIENEDFEAQEDEEITFDVTDDSDTTVEVTDGPGDVTDNGDGTYTYSYNADCDEVGTTYTVTITAEDSEGNTSTETFEITIVDSDGSCNDRDGDGISDDDDNCPDTYNPDQTDTDGDGVGDACDDTDDSNNRPRLSTGDDVVVYEGDTVEVTLYYEDFDGDALTLSADGISEDAVFGDDCETSETTCTITWETVVGDKGVYTWEFEITDGLSEPVTGEVEITVLSADDRYDGSYTDGRVIYSNVQFDIPELRPGEVGTLNVALENKNYPSLEGLQVKVVIPELGRKYVSSSLDLDHDEQASVKVPIFVPNHAQARQYIVQITVGNDDFEHQTYRELRVI